MPVEHDDESTRFDPRPWGGQQRLIPLGHRFVRPAGSDAAPQHAVEVAPAPLAPPRRAAKGTRPPRLSAPVGHGSAPVPSMTNAASIGAPIVTIAMPDYLGAQPLAMPAPMAMPAPIAGTPMPGMATTRPSAVPTFSVKHGRAIGFIVPHLPRVAEVFTSEDRTIAVRRRPLTKRSVIAAPLGAFAALVAILVIYLAQPSTKPTALGASAAQGEPHVMATIEPAAQTEPHVMTATIEPAAQTELHVMTATIEPAAQTEPYVMKVTREPVASIEQPAATSPIVEVTEAIAATDADDAAEEKRPARRRARVSKRQQKPRRIVAVDASTPLGNLRPSRM